MKIAKKCTIMSLAAALLLSGCGGSGSSSDSSAGSSDKKVLTFGCQMYTDGIRKHRNR